MIERAGTGSSAPVFRPGHGRVRSTVKTHGVHYTPPELAGFLARRTVANLSFDGRPLRALDPACGDGELLLALTSAVADAHKSQRLDLVGVDRDELAVARAREALASSVGPDETHTVETGDFLGGGRDALWGGVFDAVITNPPYVRTQILGAATARELAGRYDLSGRVDIYQAFVHALTPLIRPGGVLGLLCSNRFLSVQAGAALRDLLSREYELLEVHDLGDTKLFEAAVLPAVVIARRVEGGATSLCHFTRVYESEMAADAPAYQSPLAPLEADVEGPVRVGERSFIVERGELSRGEVWRLTHDERERWLATIDAHTEAHFADFARIRVGIKTTADKVYIRKTWDDLPAEQRPEADLLHPLITHHVARRWRAGEPSRIVLYPHRDEGGRRVVVDLDRYPRAAAYLESHRETLEGRSYVIEAGRRWYEIWVPQQPRDWGKRKVVFPDIAESPRFFLDTTGAVVNGDCYWMAFDDDVPLETLSLLLAVGNSSFAVAYYDAVCGNRLYAGRRRFITQYVKQFPLPHLDDTERNRVSALVERLRNGAGEEERERLEAKLDALVWEAFGLGGEEVRR